MHDKFVLDNSFLSIKQIELLIKFWSSLLFYLLLMCLFKQVLVALNGLLKSPAIENFVENFFGGVQNNQSYNRTEPLAVKIIHYATYTIYFGVSWILGFVLVIEVFNLHLLSVLTQSLLLSLGDLIIALLMLLLGYKFYTCYRTEEITPLYKKQSTLMMASCVLFGSLIIGGSVSTFSIFPWLILFVILGYFLIKYDASAFSDLIAGIFLRLKMITSLDDGVQNENNHLRITKLGIFVSEVSHSSGEQENINNSNLLSINAISSNID